VTVGALNEVVNEVVKSFRMLLGTEGGCVPTGAPTLNSVEIRVWGFREEEVLYLGDCIESPIYRGGELHSRCNGTPGSSGYEIVGSVTAREFIAGTCKETLGLV